MASHDEDEASRQSARADQLFFAVVSVCKACWYVITILLAALLFAWIGSAVDAVVGYLWGKRWPNPLAQHIGWLVGAVLAAIGQPLGWVSASLGKTTTLRQSREDLTETKPADEDPPPERGSILLGLKHGLVDGVIGLAIGVTLGGIFLLTWFSLALSPFGPKGWAAALQIGPVLSTNDPLALMLFLGPVAFLTLTGMLAGFVLGLIGK